MTIASSLRQLWHQLWEYPGGKSLIPIRTIFERPEPTGTSSVASDSGDAATFSRKRTTATASNSTSVTDSQPKRPRKAYEKRELARVTRTKMETANRRVTIGLDYTTPLWLSASDTPSAPMLP